LKKTVGSMRREFSLDLAGAHRVWCGPTPAERRAQAEHRAKVAAESKRAREVAERDRLAALAKAKEETERRAKAEAEHVKAAAERDRLAALAQAKEEAVRHHAASAVKKEETGRPGKKKG
ncbi:MAG TPA: hypothetical protein VFC55_07375, partial [Desulfobaccales bacterium]|nr:hypothetical protein [Desulfobaccales bacterium]